MPGDVSTLITVTSTPQQIVSGAAAAGANFAPAIPTLLFNTDPANSVQIGPIGVQFGSTSGVVLLPLQSVVVDGQSDEYAVCDTGLTVGLIVAPGYSNQTVAPSQLVEVAGLSTLAVSIAQQILKTGVSLVPAPVLLYGSGSGGGGGGGSAGTNFIGAHVDPGGYNPSGGPRVYQPNDWTGPAQFYDRVVGRVIAQAGQKWYWTEGQLETTLAALTAAWPGLINWLSQTAVPNQRVIISVKPDRSGVTASGTLNAHGTSQAASLASMLSVLSVNFPTVTFIGVPWQEPQGHENDGTSFFPYTYTPSGGGGAVTITYDNYVQAYGPTILAGVGTLCYDCLPTPEQYARCVSTNFFNPARPWTHFYADYYGANAYTSGVRLNAAYQGAGPAGGLVALAAGLIFGLAEYGLAAQQTGLPSQATYSAYISHIISVFSNLPGAQQGGDVTWYSGPSFQGPNIVLSDGTGASGVDLAGTASGDIGITDLYDALSQAPGPGGGGTSGIITIPAGSTVSLPPINPSPGGGYALASGLSYDISIIGVAGAASTIPFATVQMAWKNTDISGAKNIHQERWFLPLGANGTAGTSIFGRGPMHGQFLNIRLTNQDTVACTLTIQVNATGRPVSEHDWYWDATASVNVPTYTLAGGTSFTNDLGDVNGGTIPAGGTFKRLLSLYAGSVDCFFSTEAAPGLVTVTLNPQPPSASGGFGANAILNEPLSASGTSPGPFTQIKNFPRGPVLVTFTNTDTSTHQAFARLVALDRG